MKCKRIGTVQKSPTGDRVGEGWARLSCLLLSEGTPSHKDPGQRQSDGGTHQTNTKPRKFVLTGELKPFYFLNAFMKFYQPICFEGRKNVNICHFYVAC